MRKSVKDWGTDHRDLGLSKVNGDSAQGADRRPADHEAECDQKQPEYELERRLMIKTTEVGALYGQLMAGTVLVIAPLVIVFILFQRRFIESFASSGIK